MNFFIKTLKGKTIHLDIKENETIFDLKQRLAISEEMSIFNMRVFVDGKERKDTDIVHSLFEDPENESLFLLPNESRLNIHRFATMLTQAARSQTPTFFQKLPSELLLKIASVNEKKLSEQETMLIAKDEFDYAEKMHTEYQAKKF